MSRILVTGAAGQVGRALLAAVGPARDVTGFTSAQWDITDPGAASGRLRDGDVLVNCAAYTNVEAAETDPDTAFAVNAAGPGHLAGACVLAGARLIHISTDYVFGGGPRPPAPYEPTDATAPMQVYGAGKLAGETAVLGTLPTATVVRTAWVYTGHRGGTDFVSVMRAPPSMRASSSTRASASRGTTRLKVRSPSTCFSTCRWWSPSAAIWGRCVMQMSWRAWLTALSLRPMASAVAPPTPVSTSSKM